MKLKKYFDDKKGTGVLSTADTKGRVNSAIYGRPHFIEDEIIAFIAAERLTHKNLQENPYAVYLFKEQNSYNGKRLYLTKIREEKDSPLINDIRRHKHTDESKKYKYGSKYLIFFKVDKILPLIGDGN
jgi:hypothetical protein